MIYKLNGIDIAEYGAIPALVGEQLALSGIFDCPKRKSPTERSWGTSIEPFTDAEDIVLDNRELVLNLIITGSSETDVVNKIDLFKIACIACHTLSVNDIDFSVTCDGQLSVKHYNLSATISVSFSNSFLIPDLTATPSLSGNITVDDYDLLTDFGIVVGSTQNAFNIAKAIPNNGNIALYRDLNEMQISCIAMYSDFEEAIDKLFQFFSLLYAPGTRKILTENYLAVVYFKEGFKTNCIAPNTYSFTIKFRVIEIAEQLNNKLPLTLPFKV